LTITTIVNQVMSDFAAKLFICHEFNSRIWEDTNTVQAISFEEASNAVCSPHVRNTLPNACVDFVITLDLHKDFKTF
jgi:hypothetical protein